jgi:hypothetical protein
MTRVEIPAYTDRWMMGDRCGVLVKTTRSPVRRLRDRLLTSDPDRYSGNIEIAHVKLDKSGKTVRVILADCRDLS